MPVAVSVSASPVSDVDAMQPFVPAACLLAKHLTKVESTKFISLTHSKKKISKKKKTRACIRNPSAGLFSFLQTLLFRSIERLLYLTIKKTCPSQNFNSRTNRTEVEKKISAKQ
jgi:hypothetical protein